MVENVMMAIGSEASNAEMRAISEQLMIAAIKQQELAEIASRAEHRLRDLVHGLDAVICEVDIHTGRPVFLSLHADIFLGHALDHWQSQPKFLTEIIHSSDRERVIALFPAFLLEGQSYEYEFRALTADRSVIWFRNIVRVVHDAVGNVTLLRCVIVDVTLQKQTAQALEAAYVRERNIADTLQRSLLFIPPEDTFPGLSVKTLYEAASNEALVGGDFWDTFACDHGKVALILGDVMGHGLPAAMFTAELKFLLRGFVREHQHPGLILTQMNACLCESHRLYREGLNEEGNDAPVCVAVAIVDTATGQGAAASAGMEPPLLVRRDGHLEEMEVKGLLLGVLLGEEYAETAFQLDPGDLVLLTTDGVTEARHGQSFLGYAGLMRLAKRGRSSGTLEAMGQTILAGAKAYSGGTLRDDACVLLARRQ